MARMNFSTTLLALLLVGLTALAGVQDGAQPPSTQQEQPATQPESTPQTQPQAGAQTQPADEDLQQTAGGVRYRVTRPAGEPAAAQPGDWVSVHYSGRLEDGLEFDTSLKLQAEGRFMVMKPFTFRLGDRVVIPGWEEGVAGMRVGEKRTLIIPPELAYGASGAGRGLIPPNATLVFEVELVGLYRPDPEPGQQAEQAEGE